MSEAVHPPSDSGSSAGASAGASAEPSAVALPAVPGPDAVSSLPPPPATVAMMITATTTSSQNQTFLKIGFFFVSS
jgi:hypothetical protein